MSATKTCPSCGAENDVIFTSGTQINNGVITGARSAHSNPYQPLPVKLGWKCQGKTGKKTLDYGAVILSNRPKFV